MPSSPEYRASSQLTNADIELLILTPEWTDYFLLTQHFIAPRTEESSRSHEKLKKGQELDLADELGQLPLSDKEKDQIAELLNDQILFLPCSPDLLLVWATFFADIELRKNFANEAYKKFPYLKADDEHAIEARYREFNQPQEGAPPPTNKRRPYYSDRWTQIKVENLISELYLTGGKIPSPAYILEHLKDDANTSHKIFRSYDSEEASFGTRSQTDIREKTVRNWIANAKKSQLGLK